MISPARPAVFLPALLLLALGVSAWYVDSRLPTPDEGAMLTAAAKILRGGVFYRDIDAYPFPGSHYLLAIGMRLCGEHLLVARWMAAGCYCAIVAALYGTALQLMDRRWAALYGLSLLCFKFLAWPAFSAYLYSDVAFLGACVGIAALVGDGFRGASPRLVLAGVGIGVALAAKQSVGIYLGAASAAALLFPNLVTGTSGGSLRRRSREAAVLLLGAAVPLLPLLGYFAAQGLLGTMVESGLIRPFARYLPTSGVPFSTPLAWWRFGELVDNAAAPYFVFDYWHMLKQEQLPGRDAYRLYQLAGELFSRLVYTSIPVAFLWSLLRRLRSRPAADLRAGRRSLFAWLALAVVLSAFPRADSFHVFSVYPLVALLLFALCSGSVGERPASARLWAAASAVALLLAVCASLALHHRAHLSHRVRLARAEVWVDPANAWIEPVVEYVSGHVRPGEPIFVFGHEAQLYFLTGRFYPWPFSQLYPGQEGDGGGLALVRLLERVPPRLVLRGLVNWPGTPELLAYAPRLYEYVFSQFRTDEDFFLRHPVAGGETPPDWLISVMRPLSPGPAGP
jgi:hypothetical protein